MSNKLANIIGAGMPAQTANYISGIGVDGIVASGNSQATATLITGDSNAVTTSPGGGAAVVFSPTSSPGDEMFVKNYGASTLPVYPAPGDSIDNLATNAAYNLAVNKGAYFVKVGATRWASLLSA